MSPKVPFKLQTVTRHQSGKLALQTHRLDFYVLSDSNQPASSPLSRPLLANMWPDFEIPKEDDEDKWELSSVDQHRCYSV